MIFHDKEKKAREELIDESDYDVPKNEFNSKAMELAASRAINDLKKDEKDV